jgi:hypothetical protein
MTQCIEAIEITVHRNDRLVGHDPRGWLAEGGLEPTGDESGSKPEGRYSSRPQSLISTTRRRS